jgi:hypothetical protein
MTEYTLSDFLGIFCVYLPIMIYATLLLQKGLYALVENLFTGRDEDKNFFHHHFHYKAQK